MATAVVALASLVLNLSVVALVPVDAFQFQSSSLPTLSRSRPSTSRSPTIVLHGHSNDQDAANLGTADPSIIASANEWIQQDLETQLDIANLNLSTVTSESAAASTKAIKIIFSDIDGSLIHYPKSQDTKNDNDESSRNKILALPPSATGMRGVISSQTLSLCRDLRSKKDVKLVLVTGARTSTLLNRLPYLPRADAYCTDGGGRIFYPTNVDCCLGYEEESHQFTYTPLEYTGADSANGDLTPFGLREDMVWRKRMEDGGAGADSYKGNEVFSLRCHDDENGDDECPIDYESTEGFPILEEEIPLNQRNGHLWYYANHLVEKYGFVLDTKSYSTCFRVNKKHQTNDKFHALFTGEIAHPRGLIGKSTNLGCIDFYPKVSGKKHCCEYLAGKLGVDLAAESVCICDDENDIEMALSCSHSYIPSLTSESLMDTLRRYRSDDFTKTFGHGISSTSATEAALKAIYDTA